MFKACVMLGIGAAVVVGELVGWKLGLSPLAAAKAVMLAALVGFNCLKLNESASSPPAKPLTTHWPEPDLLCERAGRGDYDAPRGLEQKNLVA
jgi:hypothetical protein